METYKKQEASTQHWWLNTFFFILNCPQTGYFNLFKRTKHLKHLKIYV